MRTETASKRAAEMRRLRAEAAKVRFEKREKKLIFSNSQRPLSRTVQIFSGRGMHGWRCVPVFAYDWAWRAGRKGCVRVVCQGDVQVWTQGVSVKIYKRQN